MMSSNFSSIENRACHHVDTQFQLHLCKDSLRDTLQILYITQHV